MSYELAIKIEHKVQEIITQQEINGWKFDLKKAYNHLKFLEEEQDRLYKNIRPYLHKEVIHDRQPVKNPFKQDGTYTKRVQDYWAEYCYLVGGPYSPCSFQEPDLGSRQKLIKQLEKYGWKPLEYTEKGNPKLTEESLELLSEPIGKDIAKWYVLRQRHSTLQGLINNVRKDGRIPAIANTLGTPTGRMRHSVVVNIPKTNRDKTTGKLLYYPEGKVLFGTEMRDLFICEPGYKLVGHDASNLELRLLAHYMNDSDFIEAILSGDIHEFNREKAGLESRDDAKTFIYAFIYGAGDSKLGKIVGGGAHEGKDLRRKFLSSLPRLSKLINRTQESAGRGYLIGLDGRHLPIRKQHAALNTLIQGAGAIVMKMSMIYLDKWCKQKHLDLTKVRKVGDFHDEAQHEVLENYTELFSVLAVKSIIAAGKFFNLRCPLDAESKVGPSWAYTH